MVISQNGVETTMASNELERRLLHRYCCYARCRLMEFWRKFCVSRDYVSYTIAFLSALPVRYV